MPQQLVSQPKPLSRLGSYHLPEQEGPTPVPERGVSPALLTEYWRAILYAVNGQKVKREEDAAHLQEAWGHGSAERAMTLVVARYGAKIQIKVAESIAALLHEIIRPDAPFVCDAHCVHVWRGATPEQCKRFLDSLDAALRKVRERHSTTPFGHPCYEDELDEIAVYQQWRQAFARMLATA